MLQPSAWAPSRLKPALSLQDRAATRRRIGALTQIAWEHGSVFSSASGGRGSPANQPEEGLRMTTDYRVGIIGCGRVPQPGADGRMRGGGIAESHARAY